jgi:hypothetical protein
VSRDRPGGHIDVAFVDFGQAVGWDLYSWARRFKDTDNFVPTIQSLMADADPVSTIAEAGLPAKVAATFVEERSREAAVARILEDGKAVAWMDEHRRLRIDHEVVLASEAPVYEVRDGVNGTITRESHSLSRDGVPSIVIVTGEQPAAGGDPVWGSALQTTGPTAYTGPYGRVVGFYNRPGVRTKGLADVHAQSILIRNKRLERRLTVSAVAHIALEPGDRVDVVLEGTRLRMVVQALRFVVGSPDPMVLDVLGGYPT